MCPAACNVIEFSKELSYSTLSYSSIDTLLASSTNYIESAHRFAMNYRCRLRQKEMESLLTSVRTVINEIDIDLHIWQVSFTVTLLHVS